MKQQLEKTKGFNPFFLKSLFLSLLVGGIFFLAIELFLSNDNLENTNTKLIMHLIVILFCIIIFICMYLKERKKENNNLAGSGRKVSLF